MNLEASENDPKNLKYSKTLSTSIQDDRYRRQVDAAKKRAAAQYVDYPTFAAMVSAAHLQPVDRKSLAHPRVHAGKTAPAWSFTASGDLVKPARAEETERQVKGTTSKDDDVFQSLANQHTVRIGEGGPKHRLLSGGAFIKSWNALAKEPAVKRLEFLAATLPSSFPSIFRVEVPPRILMEIIETVHETTVKEETGEVIVAEQVLQWISKCSRFKISFKLIESKCRDLVDQLLHHLERFCGASEVIELRRAFFF